ncbi:MAG: DUF2927 domain-containing protein [Cypionkella sp.]|nr:DUF2927 domain-containing protein [Cypionkella sp.]
MTRSFASEKESGGAVALPHSFGSSPAPSAVRSNAELLRTFLDLEFKMESGRALPVFTRFEGPITVRMIGDVPPSARADLARLIARFRAEAGIDISEAAPSQPASINIDFQPRAAMSKVVPMAACFVVPRLSSFDEYKANRNSPAVNWTTMTSREQVAVFVPSDTSAQEVRDCLHEEVAQAMGPLNDLYHLPDSVFNDDNFNTVLTSFDMMVLRMHYAPELKSGMNESAVAARLPAILARINPRGQGLTGRAANIAPRSWVAAVEQSFGVGGTPGSRVQAAEQMLNIAMAQGWRDSRLGFSYYAKGRALSATNPAQAVASFAEAARIYRATPGASVQAAHVDMQLAAIALATGQAGQAIQFADRAIPVVQRAENASLLATLMLIKAEALENTGQSAAAKALRLDSLGWARYGFGSDGQMRARQSEIANLGARGRKG